MTWFEYAAHVVGIMLVTIVAVWVFRLLGIDPNHAASLAGAIYLLGVIKEQSS